MPAPKPLSRYQAPMSLRESERLLRNADSQVASNNWWLGIIFNFGALVLVSLIAIATVAVEWKAVAWLFHLIW